MSQNIQQLIDENVLLKQQLSDMQRRVSDMSENSYELIRVQANLQSLLHSATEGVVLLNRDGLIESVNRAAENILGLSEIELIQQPPEVIFPCPDGYTSVPQYLREFCDPHGITKDTPLIIRLPNGKDIPLAVNISEVVAEELVVFDDFAVDTEEQKIEPNDEQEKSGFELFCVIFRDLTSEIQLKQALNEKHIQLQSAYMELQEADELKTNFISNVSHELRTPLNGILGLSELLAQSKLDSEQQLFSQSVFESGKRLLTIVDNMLEYNKKDFVAKDKVELNIVSSIESILNKYDSQLQQKDISVKRDFEAFDENIVLVGFKSQLERLLSCLIDNAVKFTHNGEIRIKLEIIKKTAKTNQLKITIEDTGIGIPDQLKDRIFEPFVQGDGSKTRKHGGTGMGLAIVKQLMEKMLGHIELSSTVGCGTKIALELVLDVAEIKNNGSNANVKNRVRTKLESVVNMQKFLKIKELLGDGFSAFVESFIAEVSAKLEQLDKAINLHDSSNVRDISMSIKGSCETLGADVLSKLLEDCIKQYSESSAEDSSKTMLNDECVLEKSHEEISSSLDNEYERLCCALREA